jgi:hypothetical protein
MLIKLPASKQSPEGSVDMRLCDLGIDARY